MEKRYVVYGVRQERIAPDIVGPDVFIKLRGCDSISEAESWLEDEISAAVNWVNPPKYTIFTVYE